ncbi:MAG: ShlB/FhaC/HecB family hemolysin secretion/activation protein [Cyanobacteria bacterium J06592_8]
MRHLQLCLICLSLVLIWGHPKVIAVESITDDEVKVGFCPKLEPKTEPRSISLITFLEEDRRITIKVVGSRVFDSNDIINYIIEKSPNSEIQSIFQSVQEGQEPKLENINLIDFYKILTKLITQLYLERGYFTSTVIGLEESETPEISADNILKIEVIEKGLREIEIRGLDRLNLSYLCDRILLGAGFPFNQPSLEEQLRLLRVDPLFETIEADLVVSREASDELKVIVRVKEANSFTASFGLDNYSPPSIGSERTGAGLYYRNLTGLGDDVFVSYSRSSSSGANGWDVYYRVPLNARNATLQFRIAPYEQEITQSPFDDLDISGNSQVYEINFRQPLIRSIREELGVSVGFAFQEGRTFVEGEGVPFDVGSDDDGSSRTRTLKLSLDYIKRDSDGAWAFRSQLNWGVDIFDATRNAAPIPDGRFWSWLGQAQRVQQLNDDNLLLVRADIQLTPDSLLSAQQFTIGGVASLRGYRQNARSGDNGFRFSMENRITISRDEGGNPRIQIAPFFDMGAVWNDLENPNTNKFLDQTFLVSIGAGLLWQDFLGIDNLGIRLDYGYPLINLDDRGDNIQDDGFYFGINYQLYL